MESLTKEGDEKTDLNDSGCVQDGPSQSYEEGTRKAHILDLSDDVLLMILKYCSPRDLKALGYTCPRLGRLVCDRTLWTSVDTREQPTGRARMRWLLAHALGSNTFELLLSGYAREARGCLGHVNRKRKEVEEAQAMKEKKQNKDKESQTPTTPVNEQREQASLDGPRPHIRLLGRTPGAREVAHYRADILARLHDLYSQRLPDMPGSSMSGSFPELDPEDVVLLDGSCPGPQFTLTQCMLRQLRVQCSLTSLSLQYCNINCNTTGINHFPPTLKKLSLRGAKCYNLPLDKSFLFNIQDYLPELEYLDLSECEWLEPAAFLPLSKVQKLTHLIMMDCYRLSEFVAYASLATRYGFKQLKVLDVRRSPLGDSEISATGWLAKLEELYVSPPPSANPAVPRPADHSHCRDERLPPHKELCEWEKEEPEYFKIKPQLVEPMDTRATTSIEDIEEHIEQLRNYENNICLHGLEYNLCMEGMRRTPFGNNNTDQTDEKSKEAAKPKPASEPTPGSSSSSFINPVPGISGTSVARSSVAGTSGARSSVAGTSGASTSGASTSGARTSLASTSGARTSVAGTSGASTSGASTSGASTSGARTSGASTGGARTSVSGTSKPEPSPKRKKGVKKEDVPRTSVAGTSVSGTSKPEPSPKRKKGVKKEDVPRTSVAGTSVACTSVAGTSGASTSGASTSGASTSGASTSGARTSVSGTSKPVPSPKRKKGVKKEDVPHTSVAGTSVSGTSKPEPSPKRKKEVEKDAVPLKKRKIAKNTKQNPSKGKGKSIITKPKNKVEKKKLEKGSDSESSDEDNIPLKMLRWNKVNEGASTSKSPPQAPQTPKRPSNVCKKHKSGCKCKKKYEYVRFRQNMDPVVVRRDAEEVEAEERDNREGERNQANLNMEVRPRAHVLYVNVGQQLHTVYRLSIQNEPPIFYSFARNSNWRCRPNVENIFYTPPTPHLDATSLVTDSAVRRHGRADGEDVNYIRIGSRQGNEPGSRPNRSNLRVLSITGFRNITDRSLVHLATAAPHLRLIDFSESRVTAQGVENFKSLRPDCEVIYSPYVEPKKE